MKTAIFLLLCSAISFAQVKKPKIQTTQTPGATLVWTEASCPTCTFNIYRGATAGGEGATPIATGITGLTYVDSNVVRGNTYFWEVTAVNATGESPKSNEVSAQIPMVPSAPTGLTVTVQ